MRNSGSHHISQFFRSWQRHLNRVPRQFRCFFIVGKFQMGQPLKPLLIVFGKGDAKQFAGTRFGAVLFFDAKAELVKTIIGLFVGIG